MVQLPREMAYYSADPKSTPTQLQKGQYNPIIDVQPVQDYAHQYAIRATSQQQDDYPQKLSGHSRSPYGFYYQGDLHLLQQKLLGIVGPRLPSEYGVEVMHSRFNTLKHYQVVTISGFAKGIDQLAHRLSLEHRIPTIAVLGAGFAHYLRSADRSLLEQILRQGGLIISQFKLGFKPTKWSFPLRNKLIAQLANILFLPEATRKSGSLITTEYAYQLHKPVFSVPAGIYHEQSQGIFEKMHEKKLELISDFSACLEQYFDLKVEKKQKTVLADCYTDVQKMIVRSCGQASGIHLDELLSLSDWSYQELMQELTFLEMEGLVQQIQPSVYRRI